MKPFADHITRLDIADYNYPLPEERIAKYPPAKRDGSKLLLFRDGAITEDVFAKLPGYLTEGDLVVFNNTHVIHARIAMQKATGARIEILCLEPADPSDYQLNFAARHSCCWKCMVGNLKKWKSEILARQVIVAGRTLTFRAEHLDTAADHQTIRFSWDGDIDFGTVLEAMGEIPIPPYLNRPSEAIDAERYQTIYARYDGSVAAPTAGLHFSPQVLAALHTKGVATAEITLHVGAGTFRPVQGPVAEHRMHEERFVITAKLLHAIVGCRGKLTATGTTSMRALESAYWLGVKLMEHTATTDRLALSQWECYDMPQHYQPHEVFTNMLDVMTSEGLEQLTASTQIIIVPGYRFKVCRRLITNFHQPQSTLLLLVSAFVGPRWKDIYRYALSHNFRFLSYGDSSLLEGE